VDDASLRARLQAEFIRDGGMSKLCVAILFGSRARGTARADSDIDLAVLGDVDALHVSGVLSTVLGLEVDVVHVESASVPLLDAILRDGQVVFERSPGAASTLRARLLASQEIDRPWYARMQQAFIARVAARGILG
jgi:predicted nucleotidyltransferase